jgi:hypothetical protein
LLRALGDPAADVRARAAASLGHPRDARAVAPLIAAMSDPKVSVRSAATAALKRLGKPAYQLLMEVYRRASGSLRLAILDALARSRTPAVTELLISAVRAPDPALSIEATRHLGRRKDRAAWAVTLVPPATVLAWQLFERFSTGALPASVLAGYFQTYGFQAAGEKLRNAGALAVHACFLVFPVLLPPAILAAWRKRDRDTVFLAAWIGIFFAGAVAVFFAGSARYLLPMAAPVALLVSRLRRKWLAAGFAAQMALSLGLAAANYQHWDGYRRFAESLRAQAGPHRVWINGEWGLRYYLESDGGLALRKAQMMYPGDVVVTSELAYPVTFTNPVAPLAQAEIRPWVPLRLIGLDFRASCHHVLHARHTHLFIAHGHFEEGIRLGCHLDVPVFDHP